MVKKDQNSSSDSRGKEEKKKEKNVNLRPNKNEELKKQITNMFQSFNDEKEKSHKSIKSSERLSKQERNRVRDKIFGEKDLKPKDDAYEKMKIEEKSEHEEEEEHEIEQSNSEGSSTEYEYEYIEEEYPEGTDLQEILKNCKKGDIVMP